MNLTGIQGHKVEQLLACMLERAPGACCVRMPGTVRKCPPSLPRASLYCSLISYRLPTVIIKHKLLCSCIKLSSFESPIYVQS